MASSEEKRSWPRRLGAIVIDSLVEIERVAEVLGRPWVIALIVILVIFALAYIVLVTRYRRLRRKHLKERKLAEKRREEQKRVAQQDFFDGEWKDLY